MTQIQETDEPLLYHRQPLNLPAGSVRASLVLLIMLPFWILVAVTDPLAPMPLYLYFLLGLVLVFFASHGGTIAPKHIEDHPSPLHLPRGTLRILFILVTLGVLAWRWYQDRDFARLVDRLTPPDDQLRHLPHLMAAVAVGFSSGWGIAHLLGKWRQAAVFQDIQAAICLMGMLGLSVLAIYHLLINSQLQEPINPLVFECILTGLVAWYFGARS